jgi:hypothetical protein
MSEGFNAFSGNHLDDAEYVFEQNENPGLDTDAWNLKSQILRDLQSQPLCGGATVAFNTAAMLIAWSVRWGQPILRVSTVATIGGWVWRPRLANIDVWVRAVGTEDINRAQGVPDYEWSIDGAMHTTYFDSGPHQVQLICDLVHSGIR